MKKSYFALFNRFEIEMPLQAIEDCHHQGACDDDVEFQEKKIDLSHIAPDKIRSELKEYGAWDADELADEKTNRQRIIWLAAGNIQDDYEGEYYQDKQKESEAS